MKNTKNFGKFGIIFLTVLFMSISVVLAADTTPPVVAIYMSQDDGAHNDISFSTTIYANLWNRDYQTTVTNCDINWNDGAGWQSVSVGTPGAWYSTTHTYSSLGLKTIQYRCTNSAGLTSSGSVQHTNYDTITIQTADAPVIAIYMGQTALAHNDISYSKTIFANLWNNDGANVVDQCQINWNEGAGWQAVSVGTEGAWYSVNHTYTLNGTKNIQYRCRNDEAIWTSGNIQHINYDNLNIIDTPLPTAPVVAIFLGEDPLVHNNLTHTLTIYANLWNQEYQTAINACQINWNDGSGWLPVLIGTESTWYSINYTYTTYGNKTVNYTCQNTEGLWSNVTALHTNYDRIELINNNTVNSAPVLNPIGNFTINESQNLNFVVNATDIDGDVLSYSVSGLPTGATFVGQLFNWTPNFTQNGTYLLIFTVTDGSLNDSETITITVSNLNQAPIAYDVNATTNEDVAVNITLNCTDIDGDNLTYSNSNTFNGTLTGTAPNLVYTPNLNFNSVDSFTYSCNDGTINSNNATVTITIIATNDAPVAQNDSYSVNEDVVLNGNVLTNDSDIDGDNLTAILVSNVLNGTLILNANGSFVYTPNLNFNGIDTFTYVANDGTVNSSIATVTINVVAQNDAPIAQNLNVTTNEDTAVNITLNCTDIDGDNITYSHLATANGVLTGTGQNLVYTPNANFNGADSFDYRCNDGTINSNLANVSITVNPVNDAPIVNNDSYSVNEDVVLNGNVLTNDSDIDGDNLTAILVSNVLNGTLILNANGSFVYTPNLNFNGIDTFTYVANDGTVNSSVATVTINVIAQNDAPIAQNLNVTTNEDAAVNITLNCTDIDGDSLTYNIMINVAHGSLIGSLENRTYSPDANYNGADNFTYRCSDGSTNSNLAIVSITVNPINDAPISNNNIYSTNEDITLNVNTTSGVLANDVDVDGDVLTALLVSNVLNGTLTLNANGSFVYTPNLNFNGVDTFTYVANDGTVNSSVATVTINVVAQNDAPIAQNLNVTTNEDTAVNITLNCSDNEGDPLTYSIVSLPANGVLTGTGQNRIYTPDANYNGTDSFNYRCNDLSSYSNTATVTITILGVNDAPTAANDYYNAVQDTTLNVIAPGVLANDNDPEGSALSSIIVTNPSNGNVTLNLNGSFTYNPNTGFTGIDVFTYVANDGSANSSSATVTINVTAVFVNTPPVAVNDTYTTSEDITLNVNAPGILINDFDANSDPLTALLVSNVLNGTLTLNANGSFVYTPNLNFNGVDTFTYVANDGTDNSTIAGVRIIVTPVNDAPWNNATIPDVTFDEDNYNDSLYLQNYFFDIEGDDLDYISECNDTNVIVNINNVTSNANFTAALNWFGNASCNFTAFDASNTSNRSNTIRVLVSAVNDMPIAYDDNVTTNEDISILINVTANDFDVEGTVFIDRIVVAPLHGTAVIQGGLVNYTPALNYYGPDSFVYRINDTGGLQDAAVVDINVLPVNDLPYNNATIPDVSFNEDGYNDSLYLQNYFFDIEGDDLDYIVECNETINLFVNINNVTSRVNFTAALNWFGSAECNFTAYEMSNPSNRSNPVRVLVNSVNDLPIANDDFATTAEDTAVLINVTANDTDVEGPVTLDSIITAPLHGTAVIQSGLVNYTPTSGYNGNDSFVYRINDSDNAQANATVYITITSVANAPVLNPIGNFTINESQNLNFFVNGSDADGDTLNYMIVGTPSGATFINQTFDWTPDFTQNGTYYVTFIVSDGVLEDNETVMITVLNVNAPPVLNPIGNFAINETQNLNFVVNATDIDGDSLNYSVTGLPAGATFANQLFNWTPNLTQGGIYNLTFTVTDGLLNDSETITITVGNFNIAPILNPIGNFTINESQNLNFVVNATDANGDVLIYNVSGLPAGATFAGQSFNWTPNFTQNGTYYVTFIVSDGLLEDNETVMITVVDITPNSAPVLNPIGNFAINETQNLNFVVNATDVDGDNLTYNVSGLPTGATFVGQLFNWTPNLTQGGIYNLTFTVSDGSLSDSETIIITVGNFNAAPILNLIGNQVTNENVTLTFTITATDANGDALIYSVTGLPAGARFNATTQIFTWTPTAGQGGITYNNITFRVSDGLLSDLESINITVMNTINNAPYITSTPVTEAIPKIEYVYDVNAADPDGDVLTYSLLEGPSGMTINSATGLITWTPGTNDEGNFAVTVMVSDGALNDTQSYVISSVFPSIELYPRRKMYVDSIMMNNEVYDVVRPGDNLFINVGYENMGVYDMKSSIRVTVYELGISRKIGPFNGPDSSDYANKMVPLEIPQDAQPGVYTLRMSLYDSEGNLKRTKHRDFRVE